MKLGLDQLVPSASYFLNTVDDIDQEEAEWMAGQALTAIELKNVQAQRSRHVPT